MTLSLEALEWVRTQDAEVFFGAPGEYLDRYTNSFKTPVQRLPEVPPQWRPLCLYWWAHLAGEPVPNRTWWHGPVERAATQFLLALHAEYERARE